MKFRLRSRLPCSAEPRGGVSMIGTFPRGALHARMSAASQALSIRSKSLQMRAEVIGQGDRSPAVVQRCGCEDADHRNAPVGDIRMQSVAGPEGDMSPGAALAAHVACFRQVVRHFAKHHALLLQPARLSRTFSPVPSTWFAAVRTGSLLIPLPPPPSFRSLCSGLPQVRTRRPERRPGRNRPR